MSDIDEQMVGVYEFAVMQAARALAQAIAAEAKADVGVTHAR